MQEIEIWPYEQMLFAQPRINPGKWDARSLRFWDINGSLNPSQTTKPNSNSQQEQQKWTCQIVEFSVLADHRINTKGREERDIST